MDLYENALIGTFLYGLGIEVGARLGSSTLASGVDLLQQTPLDQSLGDVLIKAPCYFRLIEFKRAGNRDPKEAEKRANLLMEIDRARDRQDLATTSQAIHRFVRIEHQEVAGRRLETRLTERAYIGGGFRSCSIPQLCQETAAAMLTPPVVPSPVQCAHYLQLLSSLNNRLKNPTGGGGTLLIAVRDGIVKYAHVPQITDIFRSHEQLNEIQATYDRGDKTVGSKAHDRRSGREREIEGNGVEYER